MENLRFTNEQKLIVLQVMKAVATAVDSSSNTAQLPLLPVDHDFLEAFRKHILGLEIDLNSVSNLIPENLATLFESFQSRQSFLRVISLVPFLDRKVDCKKVVVIENIAEIFQISDSIISILRQSGSNQGTYNTLELYRKVSPASSSQSFSRGMVEFIIPILGIGIDPSLQVKYEQLKLLPRGSLGFSLWQYYARTKFPYPGVKGGFPANYIAAHDLHHILLGCDTDDTGELEIVAFESGLMQEDPALGILPVLMQFQTSLNMNEGIRNSFNADKFFTAWKVGTTTTSNLLEDWDYWSVMPKSLDEARKDYSITPVSDIWDT